MTCAYCKNITVCVICGKGYAEAVRAEVVNEPEALRAEVARLRALINTPHTDNFHNAVALEAAHQQERWGAAHDAGKEPQDWFWLLGYLSGKALAAFVKGDKKKGLHHVVSSAAALLNWHRAATGELTAMRPGIAPPDVGVVVPDVETICKDADGTRRVKDE